mmetsp:Transcript_30148/g.82699  ORF Transcript_30148/g.82699 Transcript_30148/m.82699 type:complete len:232 (+) Transcript_30148:1188-1883(+)
MRSSVRCAAIAAATYMAPPPERASSVAAASCERLARAAQPSCSTPCDVTWFSSALQTSCTPSAATMAARHLSSEKAIFERTAHASSCTARSSGCVIIAVAIRKMAPTCATGPASDGSAQRLPSTRHADACSCARRFCTCIAAQTALTVPASATARLPAVSSHARLARVVHAHSHASARGDTSSAATTARSASRGPSKRSGSVCSRVLMTSRGTRTVCAHDEQRPEARRLAR